MRVIVLGSDGQLGASLLKKLSKANWEILAFNKQALDITDFVNVRLKIESYQPEIIINAAAYTNVDKAEYDLVAANAINHLAVKNIAKIAHQIGALLIHFSTDYVFDGEATLPYNESDISAPINVYGSTKVAAEHAIKQEMTKYIIIRTSWLFGASGENFFTIMKHLLTSSENVNVVSDQLGGPTYIEDLASFIEKIMTNYRKTDLVPYGIFHYSGHPFVSRYEFACYIKKNLVDNVDCIINPIISSLYPSKAKRPINSCLSSLKAQAVFNAPPSDWRVAVQLIIGGKKQQ